MPKFIDITGRRYGRLVASHTLAHRAKDGHILWHCQCDCGEDINLTISKLHSRGTDSCGCLTRERISAAKIKHQKSNTKIYRIWSAMKERCSRPANKAYKNYGGRGITVCDHWQNFQNFYADMGDPPPGLTLDRINNDLGYFKDNCRWATRLEQRHNRRPRKPFFRSKVRSLHNFSTDELLTELIQRTITSLQTNRPAVLTNARRAGIGIDPASL